MPQSEFDFALCADDFALSPAVSRGILEALAAGRVTATSVMTTRPSWPHVAADVKAYADRVDIGLHLNLTMGRPCEAMPTFAPNGNLPLMSALLPRARRGELPEAEIRAEIARQCDAFEAAMGCAPDFVDGHQHVQILPGIRDWLLEDMARRGWQGRAWIRDSSDALARILLRRNSYKKALMLKFLARGFADLARGRGFAVNDGFAGFSHFDAARDYSADFKHYLQYPGRTHLVMCHPGYVDDELASLDQVTATREHELRFLLSERFVEALKQNGARLRRMSEMV
ncbi:ChbG/HpnK family deacetylase [Methylovirgula sp. 4M-Z18]|uniref:ChbG/HpnK family deacetylase n=1 Tax=Methylovirgula sp. 4M-Z18 TaxID=2293567 RepID=UPI000E2E7064|nr:ChbG/HpnK family deacetylase [Methylovirgula sp. 4M-Z18]RFB81319.1 ChbG/HpnK family deacetylase [Methylovirgula sp. 4M-Z18]